MKWFYSGASNIDDAQTLSQKSLGGNRSSTIIPNGRVNSLFNDFSILTVQDGFPETKCFFIKNTFDKPVTGVLIYALYPESPMLDFQISTQSGSSVEKLSSSQDIPYYSEFYDLKVVFAYTDTTVNDTFVVGETVVIEGVNVLVSDGKRTTFMNNAVKAFETNPKYKAIILADNVLRLEYRILGSWVNQPIISTTNVGTIISTPFNFGFDNSRLISNELKPGESIGIFLQRKPSGFSTDKTVDQYKAMYDEFKAGGYKAIQNTSIKTVNFCLEFTTEK